MRVVKVLSDRGENARPTKIRQVSVGWAEDELTFAVRRAALPRARLTPPESAPCRSSTDTTRTPCPGTHPSTGYARALLFRAPLPRMRRRASFVPLGGASSF